MMKHNEELRNCKFPTVCLQFQNKYIFCTLSHPITYVPTSSLQHYVFKDIVYFEPLCESHGFVLCKKHLDVRSVGVL